MHQKQLSISDLLRDAALAVGLGTLPWRLKAIILQESVVANYDESRVKMHSNQGSVGGGGGKLSPHRFHTQCNTRSLANPCSKENYKLRYFGCTR